MPRLRGQTGTYTPRERIMAERFVQEYFPGVSWDWQVPIYDVRGIPQDMLATFGLTFFERSMPRADILIELSDRFVIAEVKSIPKPSHVASLDFYVDALKHDVTRQEALRYKKIEAWFVAGKPDVRIEEACRRRGYRYAVVPPP